MNSGECACTNTPVLTAVPPLGRASSSGSESTFGSGAGDLCSARNRFAIPSFSCLFNSSTRFIRNHDIQNMISFRSVCSLTWVSDLAILQCLRYFLTARRKEIVFVLPLATRKPQLVVRYSSLALTICKAACTRASQNCRQEKDQVPAGWSTRSAGADYCVKRPPCR